jgi:hypothetical protein
MLDNNARYWTIALDLGHLFGPAIVTSLVVALVLSSVTAYEWAQTRTFAAAQHFTNTAGFIFSFAIVGFALGMIIRLLGGFSLGSGNDATSPDSFQFIATIASSFAAIAGLFFGESKLEGAAAVRPIGTATAIFMMMFGYFYLALVLAGSSL